MFKRLFPWLMMISVGCFLMTCGSVCLPVPATEGDGQTDGGDQTTDGTADGTTDGTADGTTDGTGDGTVDTAVLTIVKTGIDARHDAGLKCGDDVIAFGTENATSINVGVSYVIPSQNPTAGTPVPNGELYDNSDFAVGGKTIFLAGSNTGNLKFQVSVFDVASATITKTFDANDIYLNEIPGSNHDVGNIQADGNYCAVICNQNEVTDGKIIKVIDVSGAAPALISFDQNPDEWSTRVPQVAVDAATKKVVAVVGSSSSRSFYVYDITNPTAAPTQIAAPNGVSDKQIAISGNYIIYLDNQNYPMAMLVDLVNNSVVNLNNALAARAVAIGGNTFAFFADVDANDRSGGGQRTAVGTVPGPGFSVPALDNYVDGSTENNGLVGFGTEVCVTPAGDYVFISDPFQYSTGGASFVVPADPDGSNPYACPARDLDCSSNTVGFKTTTSGIVSSTDTTVAYIILP